MAQDARIGLFNVGSFAYDVLTAQTLWQEQIARVLELVAAPKDDVRVLDLGCGPGVSTFVLARRLGPQARLVGIDLAHKMIERAQRHRRTRFAELSNVRFVHADAAALPFADASFELATGHSFLYLVTDRAAVLREVHRVLRPGGSLVLMEPHADGSLRRAARSSPQPLRRLMRRPWSLGRFVASMVLWRLVSSRAGRMDPAGIGHLFRQAGFVQVTTLPTLGGLGLHCVGHKPSR